MWWNLKSSKEQDFFYKRHIISLHHDDATVLLLTPVWLMTILIDYNVIAKWDWLFLATMFHLIRRILSTLPLTVTVC